MKKLTVRDGIASLALLAVLIPYIGYLIRSEMPLEDPPGLLSGESEHPPAGARPTFSRRPNSCAV